MDIDNGGSLLAPAITLNPVAVFTVVPVPIADIVEDDDIGFELVLPPPLVAKMKCHIQLILN